MINPLIALKNSPSLGFSLCLVAAVTIPVSTVLLTTLPLSTQADDWSSGGLTYGKETVNQIGAGQTVILNGTKVMGSVMTGQSILCNDCDAEDLIASQNVVVNEGDVSKIMAGQSVTLNDAAVRGNVQAGQSVHLKKATIHGNVDTRSMVDMVDSTINGTLTTVSNRLHLFHSTIGDLRLNEDDASSSSSSSSINSFNNNSSHHRYHHSGNHSQVIISGSSVISGGPNGRTRVRVNGPSSHSMLNGYAVTTVPQGTQVVTPEGYVYRNGYRLGSDGPAHYGLYHQQNAMAPMIEGPQWPNESTLKALPSAQADATTTQNDSPAASLPDQEPEKPLAFQPPKQTLILDSTTIQGSVYFESGAGQVILQNGGQILGQVVGGSIVQ